MRYRSGQEEEYPYDACQEVLMHIVKRTMQDACMCDANPKNKQLKKDAMKWLFNKSQREWSCLWVLSYLTDCPEKLQKTLQEKISGGL